MVQAPTPAVLLSSAWRGSLQNSNTRACNFTGPLESRDGIIYQKLNEKKITLMHGSACIECSCILKSVPINSVITSLIVRLYFIISREWSFNPHFPLLRCKTEIEERLCLYISLIASISGRFKLWWKHSESMWEQRRSRDQGESSCKPASSDLAHAARTKCCNKTSTEGKKPLA